MNVYKFYSAQKTGYHHIAEEELTDAPKQVIEENFFLKSFASMDIR
jgi:hypothetical protein